MTGSLTYTDDQGRQLLERELADPRYQREYSGPLRQALDRFLSWLGEASVEVGPVNIPYGPIIAAVLVIGAIIVCILVVRPRLQRSGTAEQTLNIEESVTAEQLRLRAEDRRRAGDFDAAFRELFRAMVRTGEENGLRDQRGRTATEAAADLAAYFPGGTDAPAAETAAMDAMGVPALAPEIFRAAEKFNLSRYGGVQLGHRDYDQLLRLDAALITAYRLRNEHPAQNGQWSQNRSDSAAPGAQVAPR
ncbi:DUF4129 domain-containing protein [Nesterenkonia rhizosphaerae]|uniref:Protein-glutamine gamma-glutamyltransferase-like C-terminal domain-containing protein n=1 Tax=Nesterenkonia rhizosphaerae TaxID=1348272 RepID=A0ABP9FNV4_9MICC